MRTLLRIALCLLTFTVTHIVVGSSAGPLDNFREAITNYQQAQSNQIKQAATTLLNRYKLLRITLKPRAQQMLLQNGLNYETIQQQAQAAVPKQRIVTKKPTPRTVSVTLTKKVPKPVATAATKEAKKTQAAQEQAELERAMQESITLAKQQENLAQLRKEQEKLPVDLVQLASTTASVTGLIGFTQRTSEILKQLKKAQRIKELSKAYKTMLETIVQGYVESKELHAINSDLHTLRSEILQYNLHKATDPEFARIAERANKQYDYIMETLNELTSGPLPTDLQEQIRLYMTNDEFKHVLGTYYQSQNIIEAQKRLAESRPSKIPPSSSKRFAEISEKLGHLVGIEQSLQRDKHTLQDKVTFVNDLYNVAEELQDALRPFFHDFNMSEWGLFQAFNKLYINFWYLSQRQAAQQPAAIEKALSQAGTLSREALNFAEYMEKLARKLEEKNVASAESKEEAAESSEEEKEKEKKTKELEAEEKTKEEQEEAEQKQKEFTSIISQTTQRRRAEEEKAKAEARAAEERYQAAMLAEAYAVLAAERRALQTDNIAVEKAYDRMKDHFIERYRPKHMSLDDGEEFMENYLRKLKAQMRAAEQRSREKTKEEKE